jgi:hypothetical protein
MWEISSKRYAQGFHGKRVTILADEAIGVSSDIWDAIEDIRPAGDVRLVMLCNPTVPSGPVSAAAGAKLPARAGVCEECRRAGAAGGALGGRLRQKQPL